MRTPLKSRGGSVILYVLVVSIVVAVIAAFLSKLFLARYTLAIRQQNSAAGRLMSESVYAVLTTAWVPYLATKTAPSCSDACPPNFPGSPCTQCLTNDGSAPGTPGNALPSGGGMGCKCQVSCNNPEDPSGTPVTARQSYDTAASGECALQIVSRPD